MMLCAVLPETKENYSHISIVGFDFSSPEPGDSPTGLINQTPKIEFMLRKQDPGLATVHYRTLVDRFRTQNSKKSSRHLVFASCTIRISIIGGVAKNAPQVQPMAIILLQEKDVKNFKKWQLFCRVFRIYYFGV